MIANIKQQFSSESVSDWDKGLLEVLAALDAGSALEAKLPMCMWSIVAFKVVIAALNANSIKLDHSDEDWVICTKKLTVTSVRPL